MTTNLTEERTYGNWSGRESNGQWGLNTKTTYAVIGSAVVGVAMMRFLGVLTGAVFAGVVIVAVAGSTYRVQGLSVYERIKDATTFRFGQFKGEKETHQGPLTPIGGTPLTGYGAHIRLHTYLTPIGVEVGVLVDTQANTITIVWRVDPIGEENIDFTDRDRMVAFWGVLLRDLGQYGDVRQVAATIEDNPATGIREMVALESALSDDAPQAAADNIRLVEEELPSNSFETRSRLAITFKGGEGAWDDQIGTIARRFPGINAAIGATEMGSRMLRAEEVIEFVRRAYDPATQIDFDELRAYGQSHNLNWSNVGPLGAKEHRLEYAHESATSSNYVVWEWPKDGVNDSILAPLLEVNPRLPRKRVTLLYRPETAANARSITENQERDAMRAAQRVKRGLRDVDAINREAGVIQSRQEVSRGAGWTGLACVVTVTSPADADTSGIDVAVSDLATQCSLRVRPAAFHQASTFQFGLGIGLVPPSK